MKTIRILLLVGVLTLTISSIGTAQSFNYGLHLGGGVSTIIEKSDFDSPVEKSLKFGIRAGVSAEFEILEFLNIGASVSFFQKGDKIKDDFATSRLSLGYLDIPIYVGVAVPIRGVKVTGFVGPYTSVAIIGSRNFEYIDDDVVPNFEWNFEESGHAEYVDPEPVFNEEVSSYKRFDTGICAGIMLGMGKYSLSATYSRGLRDIKTNETIKAVNSSVNLTFIYFIN